MSSPPVTTRRSARPPRGVLLTTLDVAAAFICAMVILGAFFAASGRYALAAGWLHTRLWLPPLLAIGLSVPVAVRRRAPLAALMIVLAGSVITLGIGGALTLGPFLPLALVLYVVAAARRTVAVTALAAALALLSAQAYLFHRDGVGPGDAVAVSFVLIICWVVGYGVQQRRAYALRLQEQAASAAVTEERLRIARELHDVVAHSMTVVAVQAGFGEYVFDSHPTEARAALGAIQTVTRDALTDMQRLLGVLRQAEPTVPAGAPGTTPPVITGRPGAPAAGGERTEPGQVPLAPAPGLADLDRLVTTTAGAGVQVTIRRTGQVRQIPAGADLSAFRIVQEALTNVVKHSGAARCLVGVDYGATRLSVSITDPGPCAEAPLAPGVRPATRFANSGMTPRGLAGRAATAGGPAGTGHGIVGMAERVSLCGGQFSAGPLPTGGFGVRAHLPLPAASATPTPAQRISTERAQPINTERAQPINTERAQPIQAEAARPAIGLAAVPAEPAVTQPAVTQQAVAEPVMRATARP